MVSLLVDTVSFIEAATHARNGAKAVERALGRATSGFSGSSQMGGSDTHGRKWAESYDQAVGQIFGYLAQLQDAASAVSQKLATTGYVYELIEMANAGVTDVPLTMPPPITTTSCPYIPSAAGGERKFPNTNPAFEWVEEQISNLIGDMWPDGDTAKLDHASTVWHALADDLDDFASNFTQVNDALTGVTTPDLSAVHDDVHQVRDYAKKLATACRSMGKACNDLSGKINYVHIQTGITLTVTIAAVAATVAVAAGLTPVTFGLSDLAGAGGVAAEVAGAVSTITGFIGELALTISSAVAEFVGCTSLLVGVSADVAASIGIAVGDTVADLAVGAVVWGAGGAVENTIVTAIAEPGSDLGAAAEQGFVGGAIGGVFGTGIGKIIQVIRSDGTVAYMVSTDAAVAGISDDMKAQILAMDKGTRPAPNTYLSQEFIDAHLAKFENGATRIMPQGNLGKYGLGQVDGTSFVLSRDEVEAIFAKTSDPAELEQHLGLPPGSLAGDLVRIDIPDPLGHGGRIPDGNEAGANEWWQPGGKLPNGDSEIVIDVAGMKPGSDYYAVKMEIGK